MSSVGSCHCFELKDEIVLALLTKENGPWQITYRSADYSLLC
jgi:hypothetical protein